MRAALRQVLLADPMPWAMRAEYAWDFLKDRARFNRANVGALANTPNWTFTRASTGFAQNAAGVLVPFASGELRRTDKGVLIEGARTNLCLRSQEFDNASWLPTNATITPNTFTAPDGTLTADKIEATTTLATQLRQSVVVAATACSATVYAHKGSGATVANGFGLRNDTTTITLVEGTLNYDTGVFTYTTGSAGVAVEVLGGGWYRVSLSVSAGITSGDTIRLRAGFNGASATAGDFCYLWGAQLEAASFPSSYIPTTTASATRAADALSVTGLTGVGSALSGMHRIARVVDAAGVENLWQIDDGTDNNRIRVAVDASDRAELLVVAGGVTQAQIAITGALAVGTTYNLAWRVTDNSAQLCRGGTLGTEDTSVTVPTGLTTIRFGAGVSGANPCYGFKSRDALFMSAKQ